MGQRRLIPEYRVYQYQSEPCPFSARIVCLAEINKIFLLKFRSLSFDIHKAFRRIVMWIEAFPLGSLEKSTAKLHTPYANRVGGGGVGTEYC